jgi:lysine N6-hydroxylase
MDSLDLIGVGIGPFNLGLAALLDPTGAEARFFDRRDRFEWHPGLMLEGTTVQVPFLADLVTMADPTSEYSFLNYLRERDRLFRFFFREDMHIERREFQAYCRWAADRMPQCRFGHSVTDVRPGEGTGWEVDVTSNAGHETLQADHVVVGVGTVPNIPEPAKDLRGEGVVHSEHYLEHREAVGAAERVCVVGSGQSAGEIVLDLLRRQRRSGQRIEWYTRSDGFLPMEYSKLGLEHFSPEYTKYFYDLDPAVKDRVRAGQDLLYKGMAADTSAAIFDELYSATIEADDPPFTYRPGISLVEAEYLESGIRLGLVHNDTNTAFARTCDALVLATGQAAAPLPPTLGAAVEHDDLGRPVVDEDYRLRRVDGRPSTLFVQNAELHSHGVGAPDLTLGSHRNSVIANAVMGKELYRVCDRNVFQSFGPPGERSPVRLESVRLESERMESERMEAT